MTGDLLMIGEIIITVLIKLGKVNKIFYANLQSTDK